MTYIATTDPHFCRHCHKGIVFDGSRKKWTSHDGSWECSPGGQQRHSPAPERHIDEIISWADSADRLQVSEGDWVVEDGKFVLVTEIHYDPVKQMRVSVGLSCFNSLRFKDPADRVAIRRYAEEV